MSQNAANGHTDNFRGRARGRGRGDRGAHTTPRRNRAEFSQAGPNHDKSITTVVVEQIPEENFEEAQVRDFFSAFGNIEEVTMQAYKHLALVKFDNHYSARAAYDSPKVIFDNRFVKVYWYNPNTLSIQPNSASKVSASSPTSATTPKEPTFDRAKFERDSEAAQKKLEERKALQQQNEAKLAELAKQKEELAQRQADERRRLEEKLKAKGLPTSEDPNTDSTMTGDESQKPTSNTEALRVQLKALEDEAKSLGIDPERVGSEPWTPGRSRGRGGARGRGSYRGWEGYAGRGGYDSSRGSRGRGAFRGATRAGGAYNLDNRPKKVKVEGVVFDDAKDESLRQFLFVRSTLFLSPLLFSFVFLFVLGRAKKWLMTMRRAERRRIHVHQRRQILLLVIFRAGRLLQGPLHGGKILLWAKGHPRSREVRVLVG